MDSKILAQAKEIAKSTGCKIVYLNSKGEWFTQLNPALNSDKKENIQTFDFTKEALGEAVEGQLELLASAAIAAEAAVLKKIAAGKKQENIEALIAGFEEDEEVKAAIAAKVASLAPQA